MTSHVCLDCDTVGAGSCRLCQGEGKILSEKRFGKFAAEMPCPRCKGNGTCPTCGGTGAIEAGGESGQRDTKKSTNSA